MSKRVMIFGATGTVGAGTLLECLDHPEIDEVICVLRRPNGREHPKLREVIHDDFMDFSSIAAEFGNIDGCFWAIGVPSSGRSEEEYTRITHDYTFAAAEVLREQSPQCCFVLISGAGADETENSRQMWARVKGRTENSILGLGFARALIFRPGAISAKRGIKHSVRAYGWSAYLAPLMRPFGWATSTVEIGRGFIAPVLEEELKDTGKIRLDSADINAFAKLVKIKRGPR